MLGQSKLKPPLVPMSYSLGRAWHVASVWGRHERDVVDEIAKLGLGSFLPMQRFRKAVRGRLAVCEQPLFPGYVFVHFDPERERVEWGTLLEADGVIDVLASSHDIPIRVDDDLIDKLRRAETAGVFDFTKPSAAFAEGDTVEIMEGPFAGVMAQVRVAKQHKRLKLLLAALGIVEIDACYCVKTG